MFAEVRCATLPKLRRSDALDQSDARDQWSETRVVERTVVLLAGERKDVGLGFLCLSSYCRVL